MAFGTNGLKWYRDTEPQDWLRYSLNPPTPETFLASDFHNFFKCWSFEALEKGLKEKKILFWPEVCFFDVAKNVYLGVTGYVS